MSARRSLACGAASRPASAARRDWMLSAGALLLGAGQQPSAAAGRTGPPWALPRAERMALVIGIGAYAGAPLKNARADARLVGDALGGLGFATERVVDSGRDELLEALATWLVRARHAAVRFVYFAGHGAQFRGRSYLVPADAELRDESELPARAVEFDATLDAAGHIDHGVSVFVLDACRGWARPGRGPAVRQGAGRTPPWQTGLAAAAPARGTFVAYATAPGRLAGDHPAAPNGVYARCLARQLREPGLALEEVFKRTRAEVVAATGGAQVPWDSSSLIGQVCLAGACGDRPRAAGESTR